MKARIVVALLDETQEFQRLQAQDARTVAADAGLDAEVLFAENSAILQIQQLYRAIQLPEEQRPQAILVETVVGEGLERVARAAARAGIGWVLINRKVDYIERLRREHPALPIAAVSTDQLEIGRIQGRQFRALIPSARGAVLYVAGPRDTSAARERLQGTRDELASAQIDLKVLDGLWTEASGQEAVARWLRLKRFEELHLGGVGCQNDAMAVGARRALASVQSRLDLALLPVTGIDGLREGGQRLVKANQLAATVVVPSSTGPAVRLVARALNTGRMPQTDALLSASSFPDLQELGAQMPSRGAARPAS